MPQKVVYIPEEEDVKIKKISETIDKPYSDTLLQIIKSGIEIEERRN